MLDAPTLALPENRGAIAFLYPAAPRPDAPADAGQPLAPGPMPEVKPPEVSPAVVPWTRASRVSAFPFAVVPEPVIFDADLDPMDVRVYCVLSRFARNEPTCWPTDETIGAQLGKHRSEANRSLGRLEARCHIARVTGDYDPAHGRRRRTIFLLHHPDGPAALTAVKGCVRPAAHWCVCPDAQQREAPSGREDTTGVKEGNTSGVNYSLVSEGGILSDTPVHLSGKAPAMSPAEMAALYDLTELLRDFPATTPPQWGRVAKSAERGDAKRFGWRRTARGWGLKDRKPGKRSTTKRTAAGKSPRKKA